MKDTTSALKAIRAAFEPVIGQDECKNSLTEILLAGYMDDFLVPLLFVGPAGWGKSFLMGKVKDIIKNTLGRKVYFAENGSALGTRKEFLEDFYGPKMHDKSAVLFTDEIHDARDNTMGVIRDFLEPTMERGPKFVTLEERSLKFCPFLNSFAVATNEIDKLSPAFVSRFERLDLSAYTVEEMEEMISRGLEDSEIQFHDNTLRILSECFRGSARDIVQWFNAIKRRVLIKGRKVISREDCYAILHARKTFPRGVTATELNTLLALEKRGRLQLKQLASINGCASAEQDRNETMLRGLGLIGTDVTRFITAEGIAYLAELRAEKFIPAID